MKKNYLLLIVVLLLFIFGSCYLLAPILTPFLTGAFLAYLTNPLVSQLKRLHFSRVVSVTIAFCLLVFIIAILILLFIPLVEKQIQKLAEVLPRVLVWLQQSVIPLLNTYFGIDDGGVDVNTLKTMFADNWHNAGGVANWFFKTTLHSGLALIRWSVDLLLIPVVTFYLLCDWDQFMLGLRNLLPREIEPTIVRLMKECDVVLGAFFRGQLLVMLALGVFYALGLSLVGLQIGLIIGLIAGLMSIVPYLGFIVGVVIASIAAFVQMGSLASVSLVWLVFILGHLLEHMILTPYLVGNRVGLHPVAVIFAILAGGHLFGFLGVLLALPSAAVVMVWVRYLHHRYRHSQLYQS